MGIVDDDGIGIGNIQPAFNDGGGHKHIVLTLDKLHHNIFQFMSFHLPVRNTNPASRNYIGYETGQFVNVFHPAMNKENLSAALNFMGDSLCYKVFIEGM